MAEWNISRLSKSHDRSAFSCGKASLDNFLRSLVSQYEKRRLARTYVATEAAETEVAGFYTLATGGLDASVLPQALRKKLPEHPIPIVHLGRLAVDTKYRGRRLGEALLVEALKMAMEVGEKIGVFGVDVWAIDDEASAFYAKYGFVPLEDHPHHMILPLKTIKTAEKG